MILKLKDSDGRERVIYIDRGEKSHSVNVRKLPENMDGEYDYNQHHLKPKDENWYKSKASSGSFDEFMKAVLRQQRMDIIGE